MAVGVGGAGVATGVGGAVSSVVGVPGSSSGTSLPFRFLPCRRQGKSGVARTRTSHGNLKFVIERSRLVYQIQPKLQHFKVHH